MEETDFLKGGIEELQNMISDLENRDVCSNQVNVCANEGKKLEKELKQEMEALNKDVEKTVNEERQKAIGDEEKIINAGNKRLKEVRSEREKAKDKGMKDRIESETQALVEENRDLHRTARRKLKENGLPAYCDTKWFYTLYCTQGGIEWLVKLLVFVAGLILIPGIVVAIVKPWWFLKILLWVVVMVAFIGIYMTIYLLTKDKDNGTLEDIRTERYKISDNEKQIRKIKKGIKTDKDESYYNLGEFDKEATGLQEQITEATNIKNEKLKDFEENKKTEIIDKVNINHASAIQSKKDEISKKVGEYQNAVNVYNESSALITYKYEKYFTKQYTNKLSAQKMIELIQNGQAQNIEEAFNLISK